MEMIKDQHFVASHSGPIVRAHLNMLEGWACGVGLKEEVLKNLAHLSAAVDLLATEEAELVQVSNACMVCVVSVVCARACVRVCVCVYVRTQVLCSFHTPLSYIDGLLTTRCNLICFQGTIIFFAHKYEDVRNLWSICNLVIVNDEQQHLVPTRCVLY